MRTENRPVSSLTAGELTAAGKAALALLARADLARVTGGWRGGGQKISIHVAAALRARGLARQEISGSRHRLVITGAGRMLAGVIEGRKRA